MRQNGEQKNYSMKHPIPNDPKLVEGRVRHERVEGGKVRVVHFVARQIRDARLRRPAVGLQSHVFCAT